MKSVTLVRFVTRACHASRARRELYSSRSYAPFQGASNYARRTQGVRTVGGPGSARKAAGIGAGSAPPRPAGGGVMPRLRRRPAPLVLPSQRARMRAERAVALAAAVPVAANPPELLQSPCPAGPSSRLPEWKLWSAPVVSEVRSAEVEAPVTTTLEIRRKASSSKGLPDASGVEGTGPATAPPPSVAEGAELGSTPRRRRQKPASDMPGIMPAPPREPGTYRVDELRGGQCRFACTPDDAPRDAHRFCGAPTRIGPGNLHGSWCEAHRDRVFERVSRPSRPSFPKSAERGGRR